MSKKVVASVSEVFERTNFLLVSPEMAQALGTNEAIILQQIRYWINKNILNGYNFRDGYYWTYNSYPDWQKQFPFMSVSTIKNCIRNLEKKGILISANYNKYRYDRTKWYRINGDINLEFTEWTKVTPA